MTEQPFETPFDSAEEAFFNMVTFQKYAASGAKIRAGQGLFHRPGSANDTRIVIERLYRERKLSLDHVNVLRWYGKREMRPDERREKEARAAMLWDDAMDIIGAELVRKGMVRHATFQSHNAEINQYWKKLLSDAGEARPQHG